MGRRLEIRRELESSFKERVFKVVGQIPRGRVLTYKEAARRAGRPRAYRAVGNILNSNTDKKIPCHRVIRSDGTAGGYRYGAIRKRRILKREGLKLL